MWNWLRAKARWKSGSLIGCALQMIGVLLITTLRMDQDLRARTQRSTTEANRLRMVAKWGMSDEKEFRRRREGLEQRRYPTQTGEARTPSGLLAQWWRSDLSASEARGQGVSEVRD
jgi:hypothetical protein